MLESITLQFSEIPDLVIPAEGVTIFVGPNNSGKSLLLRELETAVRSNGTPPSKILKDFQIIWPSETELEEDIGRLVGQAPEGTLLEKLVIGRFNVSGQFESVELRRGLLLQSHQSKSRALFCSQFLRFFQIRLDGRTRFELTEDRAMGDLTVQPKNVLAHLFQDDELRKKVKQIVYDAFGVYFVIDPTNGGQLRIRLSETEPAANEQSLDSSARDFHKRAMHIKDASDGVQAFVGILTAVLSGDYRSILVDEPEAFLHPPLARKLGYQLASTAKSRGGSLMASTHSSDFLMGCLQGASDVRVVRLEYSKGRSKGQVVDPDALRRFFKAPLIRSANVISALFHDGVVVTESDNDRAFYSEIYYRLVEKNLGLPSILFVNAQNKQTIRDIIGPLRAFGVPAAAIVDIDILKDGGGTWAGWLDAAQIPAALHGGLAVQRNDLNNRFAQSGINMKTQGGVEALLESDRAAAHEFFDTLARYGVFVTRGGELENWLSSLGVPKKKTDWTVAMLERLGSDSSNSSYIHPSTGDVWDFMRAIVGWIQAPSRKGTG